MPDIPEEAVEAAAKADYEDWTGRSWASASDYDQITWVRRMNLALAAAYPLLHQQIETEVREQIAQEIEARTLNMRSLTVEAYSDGLRQAARTARGAAQPGEPK